MGFFSKSKAQGEYGHGTALLTNLPRSSHPSKDLLEAIKALEKAVKLDPKFADAHHNLAHAWYLAAEANAPIRDPHELALDAVDHALAIRSQFPQAHNTRAMILAKMGRLDEALKETDIALSQMPGYQNATDNQEKIKGLIQQRAAIPGYKNEADFLQKIKDLP